MKAFYPNLTYNRSKRKTYFTFLILAAVLIGGAAVAFFILGNVMVGLMFSVIVVLALTTLPSAMSNYPVKEVPLIEVNGTKVKLYDKTEYRVSEIIRVDVLIDVAPIKGTNEEKLQYLSELASVVPQEKITGACDIVVKNPKGKEETQYNIVNDCMGALQALVDAGVKKYRVIFSMKRLSVKAKFRLTQTGAEEKKETLGEMSETDKLMQLM